MPFRFRVDGEEWTSDDLTLGEQCDIERKLGLKWSYLDPVAEVIPRQAVIAAWYSRTLSADEAEKKANALTVRQVHVEVVEDDRPAEFDDGLPVVDPKADGAAPATT